MGARGGPGIARLLAETAWLAPVGVGADWAHDRGCESFSHQLAISPGRVGPARRRSAEDAAAPGRVQEWGQRSAFPSKAGCLCARPICLPLVLDGRGCPTQRRATRRAL